MVYLYSNRQDRKRYWRSRIIRDRTRPTRRRRPRRRYYGPFLPLEKKRKRGSWISEQQAKLPRLGLRGGGPRELSRTTGNKRTNAAHRSADRRFKKARMEGFESSVRAQMRNAEHKIKHMLIDAAQQVANGCTPKSFKDTIEHVCQANDLPEAAALLTELESMAKTEAARVNAEEPVRRLPNGVRIGRPPQNSYINALYNQYMESTTWTQRAEHGVAAAAYVKRNKFFPMMKTAATATAAAGVAAAAAVSKAMHSRLSHMTSNPEAQRDIDAAWELYTEMERGTGLPPGFPTHNSRGVPLI